MGGGLFIEVLILEKKTSDYYCYLSKIPKFCSVYKKNL
ncbi:hypothetical protein SAMN05444394_3320 [Algoriphagus halophilus]|uniref:Uncharacterized protein n=1 Tax=Algoriphagus halophilus TaxID=226505 RepID=A0A1N6GKC7_9BACT|nr:hypothetical protein SAMN05444394_3320 [Algoriphagus halophilus]